MQEDKKNKGTTEDIKTLTKICTYQKNKQIKKTVKEQYTRVPNQRDQES